MAWEIAIPVLAFGIVALNTIILVIIARRSQQRLVQEIKTKLRKEVGEVADTIEHELDRGR